MQNGSIDINTIAIVGGFVINIIALVSYSNKHERRLTTVETLVKVLASQAGIHVAKHKDDKS